MNLHAIAGPVIAAVNPHIMVSYRVSRGQQQQANGVRTPIYAPAVERLAQLQPMTFRDIQQIEGLNLQGTRMSLYLYGLSDGLVRPTRKGGDLVTLPDRSVWLVALVFEQWPDWAKCAITLQNEGGC